MQVTQTFHLENEVEQDIVTFPHLTILFFGTIHVSQSIHSAALYSAAYRTNRKATNKQTNNKITLGQNTKASAM